jgi:hypothetical protein
MHLATAAILAFVLALGPTRGTGPGLGSRIEIGLGFGFGLGFALDTDPPATTPATSPAASPATSPATTPPATPPATPATTPPATPPATPPTTPATTPPTTPPTTPEPIVPASKPEDVGTDATQDAAADSDEREASGDAPADPGRLPPTAEPRKRAYIVVDRVSTAAGVIESDNDEVIVLRDERGRLKTFTKNRVLGITYLLEGPAGRRVRVVFNDGRTLVGKLLEDGYENVSLEIEGIPAKYARAAVSEVQPYPTDEELYERFRTAIEPDQYTARYTLALWLYDRKMYAESKHELDSLLEATNHYEAKRLLNEVNAQLALMKPRENSDSPAPQPRAPKPEVPSNLLSKSDVNLIKVYELDLADPPRMQVSDELIRTLLEKYSHSELIPAKSAEKAGFFSKEPIEIVRTMFALKARELYPQIEVLGEPESLNLFRQRVHNAWVINNCATSRCHGGPDGGRLFLHNRDFKSDDTRYTNLLILLRTRIDTLPLVDFDKPTDSLLFQYALPATEARRPHPDVKGWSPALTSSRKGLQEDFVRWVRSMRVRNGEYPVDYPPPGLREPDAPASAGPDR